MNLLIREETPADREAVRRINLEAFGGKVEADIVDRIRAGNAPILSLVAQVQSRLVGHIFFSLAAVEGVQGMALGPMAVLPSHQRRGIGSRLVRRALEMIQAPFVVVLGHTEYYPRFGFERASLFGIDFPWPGIPDKARMILILDRARMSGVHGIVRYRPEFDSTQP
jgi:putative acetyltransferase